MKTLNSGRGWSAYLTPDGSIVVKSGNGRATLTPSGAIWDSNSDRVTDLATRLFAEGKLDRANILAAAAATT